MMQSEQEIKETAQANTCTNCGAEVHQKYCPDCGQKKDVPRLRFKTFFEDFLNRMWGFDGMVLRTIKELTLRPGKVMQEYIRGVRVKYVGPVSYYFLLFAVYFLIMELFDIDLTQIAPDVSESMGIEESEEQRAFKESFQAKVFDNMHFLGILQFPFIAWWARVFFKKSGYNFLENTVFAFYASSHPLIISTALLPLTGLSSSVYYTFNLLFSLVYFIWCTIQFYKIKNIIAGILKGLFFYIVIFISFIICIGILAGLIGIVIGLTQG
ncbi:DUF3667 domain-containing protein [Fulvivirgaceae bacterium BMA10]|uniref:DUF3667 domain-containing protein n=1 Tax=Splendidivirga corallicola TaxID=3051826 RepID=A0ABT8KI32_9BACT|nr:DUF3667 domain-containing protein [Fulvivirgaceae bacterium BMA10]